jgi:hypothetical protein
MSAAWACLLGSSKGGLADRGVDVRFSALLRSPTGRRPRASAAGRAVWRSWGAVGGVHNTSAAGTAGRNSSVALPLAAMKRAEVNAADINRL